MKNEWDGDLILELGLPSDAKNQFVVKITNWSKEGPKDLIISDNRGEVCSIKNLAHLREYGEALFKVRENTTNSLESMDSFFSGTI